MMLEQKHVADSQTIFTANQLSTNTYDQLADHSIAQFPGLQFLRHWQTHFKISNMALQDIFCILRDLFYQPTHFLSCVF